MAEDTELNAWFSLAQEADTGVNGCPRATIVSKMRS